MKSRHNKIKFEDDICVVHWKGEDYKFLILGEGVIPIGINRNVNATIELRPHIKECYQKEIEVSQKWQIEKEIELELKKNERSRIFECPKSGG